MVRGAVFDCGFSQSYLLAGSPLSSKNQLLTFDITDAARLHRAASGGIIGWATQRNGLSTNHPGGVQRTPLSLTMPVEYHRFQEIDTKLAQQLSPCSIPTQPDAPF